jgi:hypothetical protein
MLDPSSWVNRVIVRGSGIDYEPRIPIRKIDNFDDPIDESNRF